jgi:hypothetical protein
MATPPLTSSYRSEPSGEGSLRYDGGHGGSMAAGHGVGVAARTIGCGAAEQADAPARAGHGAGQNNT